MEPPDEDGPGWEWQHDSDFYLWHTTYEASTSMDARQFTGGQYLKKEDFPQPRLLTIKEVFTANLAQEGQPAKERLVMRFAEAQKGMVMNPTNTDLAAAMFGTWETDAWVNKKIVVYTDPEVRFQGKKVGGLAVRAPKGMGNTTHPRTMPQGQPAQQRYPDPAPQAPELEYTEANPPPFDDEIPF